MTTANNLRRGLIPFFSIWVKPRRTMRAILETNPRRLVIPLAILTGFSNALDSASGLPWRREQHVGLGHNLVPHIPHPRS